MKNTAHFVAALALACAGWCAPAAPRAADRPNIVFVIADDIGYGDLACLGNPVIETPHFDRFHAQSVRFSDFHVSPTCAPTRAALMTGRHEFRSGVTHTIFERERMALSAATIAQVLKGAGYATGIFGKWHLGDEAAYQPGCRGFDEVFIHGGGGIGQTYPGSCGDAPGNRYFDPVILHNGIFEKTRGYCTDVFFAEAVKWIDRQRGKQPFFAWIAPNVAHAPLQCPEGWAKRYDGKVPGETAKFFGMITELDEQFGKLLAALNKWEIERDTLVVFMTDNGGTVGVKTFNGGRRAGKATPYQGGTRVPSFWRWPAGFAGGVEVSALTAHLDVFPTLIEIARAPLAEEVRGPLEGRSLMPLLKNPGAPWPDRLLFTHVGRWDRSKVAAAKYEKCSVRDSRFTLVNNAELYDLRADPAETKNVIADHPAAAARLRSAYDQWWDEIQPDLMNENAVGPPVNPFKEAFWRQFGGGPDRPVEIPPQ